MNQEKIVNHTNYSISVSKLQVLKLTGYLILYTKASCGIKEGSQSFRSIMLFYVSYCIVCMLMSLFLLGESVMPKLSI